MNETNECRWVNYEGLSQYLGVKETTLRKWVHARRIPYHKMPGSSFVRFDRAEVDEWLRSGRVETKEEYLTRQLA